MDCLTSFQPIHGHGRRTRDSDQRQWSTTKSDTYSRHSKCEDMPIAVITWAARFTPKCGAGLCVALTLSRRTSNDGDVLGRWSGRGASHEQSSEKDEGVIKLHG